MKFTVTGRSRQGVTEIEVSHGDEKLVFLSQGYGNAAIHDPPNLFTQINDFLGRHDEKVQAALFECYQRAYKELNEYTDVDTMTDRLTAIVKDIYNQFSLEDVRTYITLIPGLKLPDTIHKDYTPDNQTMDNYVARTFLERHYYDLATAGMAGRMMVPLWGWIMNLIRKEVGNKFKEEYAMQIISGSALDTWRGTEKLRDFILANTDSGGNDLHIAALMGGISSESTPNHLTALGVVRKLVIEPIDSNHNLVSIIYNYVTGTRTRIDTRFLGNVQLKRVSNNDRSDDDNSAVTDAWKLTEQYSDGTRSPYIVYTEDVEKFMRHVSRTKDNPEGNYNNRIFRACMANYRKMLTAEVSEHQVWLTMLVVASKRRAMTPPAVATLDKQALLRAILVTQAWLWENGFLELAALMTVTPPDPDRAPIYPPVETQRRIPTESREELAKLYPYYRMETGSRANNVDHDDLGRRPNEAVKAIELIYNAIRKNVWMLHGPKALSDAIDWLDMEFPYRASGEIRVMLTDLILKINA